MLHAKLEAKWTAALQISAFLVYFSFPLLFSFCIRKSAVNDSHDWSRYYKSQESENGTTGEKKLQSETIPKLLFLFWGLNYTSFSATNTCFD